MEIYTDREGEIILKKYSPIGELTNFAKEYAEAMAQVTNCLVCITDQDQVIAAAGMELRDFINKPISEELEELIARRQNVYAHNDSKDYVPILKEKLNQHVFQVIHTIICAGDAIGSVVILAVEKRGELGSAEIQLAAVAAEFLGKQMEN